MTDGSPGQAARLDGRGLRLAILVSRFNSEVTQRLLDGAQRELERTGVGRGGAFLGYVPGAFELPFAAKVAAESRKFDAIVALGCVVRGETDHYRVVCDAAARGLMDVALTTGVPVAFGVLTTDTLDQALARSGADLDGDDGSPGHGNKGAEAVRVAVEMARHARDLTRR